MSAATVESGARRDHARGAAGQQQRVLSPVRQDAAALDRRNAVREEHAGHGCGFREQRQQRAAAEVLRCLVSSQQRRLRHRRRRRSARPRSRACGSFSATSRPRNFPRASRCVSAPLQAALYHDTSDQPYTASLWLSFPGYDSPDYAAGQIFGDVLSSQRSDFGGLPFTRQGARHAVRHSRRIRRWGSGIAFGAVPVTTPPANDRPRAARDHRRATRRPACRPSSSRRRNCARSRSSSSTRTRSRDWPTEWSQAVAVQGLSSPDDMIAQFERVSVADVNRVLRNYLDNKRAVVAYAVPKNTGATQARQRRDGQREQRDSAHDARAAAGLGADACSQHLAGSRANAGAGRHDAVQRHSLDRSARAYHRIPSSSTARFTTIREFRSRAGRRASPTSPPRCLPYGTTTYDRVALQSRARQDSGDDARPARSSVSTCCRRTSIAACSCWPTRNCIRLSMPTRFTIVRATDGRRSSSGR